MPSSHWESTTTTPEYLSQSDYLEAIIFVIAYLSQSWFSDSLVLYRYRELPRAQLVGFMYLVYSLSGFWALFVLGRVFALIVNTLFLSSDSGALFFAPWVYCSHIVAVLGPRLTVPHCIEEPIVPEAAVEPGLRYK